MKTVFHNSERQKGGRTTEFRHHVHLFTALNPIGNQAPAGHGKKAQQWHEALQNTNLKGGQMRHLVVKYNPKATPRRSGQSIQKEEGAKKEQPRKGGGGIRRP